MSGGGAGYLSVRINLPESAEEQLPERLAGLRLLGCHVQPTTAPDRLLVEVYLAAEDRAEADRVARALAAVGGALEGIEPVPHEDWLARYRSRTGPFAVGRRWWVDPRPDDPTDAPEGRLRLAVEPRSAFGTGTHESTRLMLMELETLTVAGLSVADVGTGSGILALASERLGARLVVGVDIDPEAVRVARSTARCQGRPSQVRLVVGSADCLLGGRFDLVLCNMLLEELREVAPMVRELVARDGLVVLAGLLVEQGPEMEAVLADVGFAVEGERRLGEWSSLRVRVE